MSHKIREIVYVLNIILHVNIKRYDITICDGRFVLRTFYLFFQLMCAIIGCAVCLERTFAIQHKSHFLWPDPTHILQVTQTKIIMKLIHRSRVPNPVYQNRKFWPILALFSVVGNMQVLISHQITKHTHTYRYWSRAVMFNTGSSRCISDSHV